MTSPSILLPCGPPPPVDSVSLPLVASTMYTPLQTHWNLHYYNIKLPPTPPPTP